MNAPDGRIYFGVVNVIPGMAPHLRTQDPTLGGYWSSQSKKEKLMDLPSGIKPGIWGIAIGAIGMAIVGFSYLGWTTAATAEKTAQETANTAVVAALVPFCVVKAQADPNAATLTKFQAEQSSYSRSDIVMKAGWATLDGTANGNDALARACADKLHVAKTS